MAEGIVIGPTHHDRRFIKIMLGRWRRDGPLQSGRAPRIWPCWRAVAQRMEKIDERQPIGQRQQRSSGSRQNRKRLKFRRIEMISSWQAHIAKQKMREEGESEAEKNQNSGRTKIGRAND